MFDRRSVLGAGALCLVPWMVGGRLLETAAPAVASPAAGQESDPVLAHILEETVSAWRTAHARSKATGEELRAMAANIGLAAACLRGKGLDDAADDELQRRVSETGGQAVVEDLVRSHEQLRARMDAEYQLPLPKELFSSDTAMLSRFAGRARRGPASLKKCLPALRPPMAALARRVDGRQLPANSSYKSVAFAQKPGDDFLGYPEAVWTDPGLWGCAEWKTYGDLLVALGSELGIVAAACFPIAGCAEAVGAVAGALAGAGALVLHFVGAFCGAATEP